MKYSLFMLVCALKWPHARCLWRLQTAGQGTKAAALVPQQAASRQPVEFSGLTSLSWVSLNEEVLQHAGPPSLSRMGMCNGQCPFSTANPPRSPLLNMTSCLSHHI